MVVQLSGTCSSCRVYQEFTQPCGGDFWSARLDTVPAVAMSDMKEMSDLFLSYQAVIITVPCAYLDVLGK